MNPGDTISPTSERVRLHTSESINDAIQRQTNASISMMEGASDSEINRRLEQLDREWDIERVLQTNASLLAMAGLLLGARVNRAFLLLPAAVFSFLTQHALQGWCPPVPIFRRLGVRTTSEIERERYAIKALRGDFDDIPAVGSADPKQRVRAVLAAIDA